MRRLSCLLLCTPLVLLIGCPKDPSAASAGGVPSNATAPAHSTTNSASALSPAGNSRQGTQTQGPASASQHAGEIVAKAQASYDSGVRNYRAGHLDAARLDFDFAVDTMLSSGLDLKGDSDVAEQFERLLDAINSLEMAALKQGNGFSPKIEDAPLEAAEDITFPPNPELVARLRAELNVSSDLPLVINDQVAGYINVFSNSSSFRAHMAASLQRVGKYRGLIQRMLKEEGVPQDLIYLAVAESGFQPHAVNARSGASGMWQFMARDGAEYGLTRNGFYDYRFDPEKSSRAYAQYIKKLYGMFGDWYLAMAAYDWGPGSVQHAVQRTGFADYWELRQRNAMPAETRAYVPQILAAVIMAKNPEKYGLDKLVPSPAVIYDTVTTDYSIDLRLVADVTDTTVTEVVALNPALLRLTTPPDTSFDLHLPPGTKELYAERLKDIPADRRASWRFHVVKSGETAESIAAAVHARAEDINIANGISAQDPMAVGDELVIPIQVAASAPRPQRYTWRSGDSLVTVADRFNISVQELKQWNALRSSSVKPGRTLYVAEPVRLAPYGRARGRAARGRGGRRGSSTRGPSPRGTARTTSRGRGATHRSGKSSSHPAAKHSSHSSVGGHAKPLHGKHRAG